MLVFYYLSKNVFLIYNVSCVCCLPTVMRTQGSLRVVLNTKLWPSMTLEKGNERSLRITAMDSEKDIKIYLVMVGVY